MNDLKHAVPAALVCLLSLSFCLSGCQKSPAESILPPQEEIIETTMDPTATTPEQVEHLSQVVTEADFLGLEEYPNLKTLDLTGSTCYAAIGRYIKFHPQVQVTYTVNMGGKEVDPYAEELSLSHGEYTYDGILNNLQYLLNLKKLHLSHVNFSKEEMDALKEAYPHLEFSYTVMLFSQEYPSETETLNLSFLSKDQVQEAARGIGLLPALSFVELMNEDTSALDKKDVKVLVDAAPSAAFHYTFSLFGKTISTNDKTVEFKKHSIGNEGEPELREALAIMTGCESFRLIDCGLDNEVLAKLRADFPRTKVVWRVQFGKYSAMTDTDTIRAVYNVFDDTCFNLRYCNEVKYMDLGHNDSLTDFSFISFMPELEILIVSGSAISDLSVFENCKKLEFLEMASCLKLKDLTPLAGCESLKQLNISYTKVKDLTPLDGLPLERFMSIHTWVQEPEQKIFRQIHPDCWTTFYYGNQPFGKGWRYDDNGLTYSAMYKKVREVFDLDSIPQAWIDAENKAKAG